MAFKWFINDEISKDVYDFTNNYYVKEKRYSSNDNFIKDYIKMNPE